VKHRIRRFRTFSRRIGRGLHVEWKETIEIPKLLKNKEYKKAGEQILDICKMGTLTVVWIIPGGAVLTVLILKFSHKARPSAFHIKDKQVDAVTSSNILEKEKPLPENR
jgi:hypothetical protein